MTEGDIVIILGQARAEFICYLTGFGGARGARVKVKGYDANGKEKDFYSFVPIEWVTHLQLDS